MKRFVVLLLSVMSLTLAASAGPATAERWPVLTRLRPDERANARIDFELGGGQPEAVVRLAREIESLWNTGNWDAALDRLPALAAVAGPDGPALGINWRTPVPSPELSFNPFAIGVRDSVYVVDFEVDWRTTRHFFCVLALQGDGMGSRLSVNFSTDLGHTWSEVFILGGYSFRLNDVAGRIMLSRYWLAYTGGTVSTPNQALWCRQFSVSSGVPDTFLSGSVSDNFFNAPSRDTVKELAMVTNQLPANGTVYLLALMASDSLRYFTLATSNDTAWHVTKLTFANALYGLDACWNDGWLSSDTTLIYVSYAARGDSLYILREILGGTWQRARAVGTPPWDVTSIAAHRDTVVCAYNDDGRVRYQIRRGTGVWAVGEPPQDTTSRNSVPDVCAQGGYFHFVYRANTSYGWYTRRPYSSYAWESARRFDGNLGIAYDAWPDVRWTGRGDTAGVVFIARPTGGGRAYYAGFDYGAIAEQPVGPSLVPRLSARPVPGGVIVRCCLDRPGPATLRVCDAAGRVLRTWRLKGSAGHELFWADAGAGIRFLQLDDGRPTSIKLARVH